MIAVEVGVHLIFLLKSRHPVGELDYLHVGAAAAVHAGDKLGRPLSRDLASGM